MGFEGLILDLFFYTENYRKRLKVHLIHRGGALEIINSDCLLRAPYTFYCHTTEKLLWLSLQFLFKIIIIIFCNLPQLYIPLNEGFALANIYSSATCTIRRDWAELA